MQRRKLTTVSVWSKDIFKVVSETEVRVSGYQGTPSWKKRSRRLFVGKGNL